MSVTNNLPSSRGVIRHILEVVLLVGAYVVYELIGKYGVPNVEAVAFENATRVISWESSMGFFWEPQWQEWALQTFNSAILRPHIKEPHEIFNFICSYWTPVCLGS